MNAASKAFVFSLLISAAAYGHPVYAQAGPDLGGAAPLIGPPVSVAKEEKHNTGWALYLDNDALTTGRRDEDYTGGFTFTFSGARAISALSAPARRVLRLTAAAMASSVAGPIICSGVRCAQLFFDFPRARGQSFGATVGLSRPPYPRPFQSTQALSGHSAERLFP